MGQQTVPYVVPDMPLTSSTTVSTPNNKDWGNSAAVLTTEQTARFLVAHTLNSTPQLQVAHPTNQGGAVYATLPPPLVARAPWSLLTATCLVLMQACRINTT